MAELEILFFHLVKVNVITKNSYFNRLAPHFIEWAKNEGSWWWIKHGARRCVKKKIVCYHGFKNIKKEEYAICKIPFKEYRPTYPKIKKKKYLEKEFRQYRSMLVEEWLKFINQDEKLVNEIRYLYC